VNDSLSIVVPVRNAERELPNQLARLLEVAADLTGRFEIVVVDDASTDQTVDVIRGLVSQYPQIYLVRHREPRGTEAALRTGLQWARGETVLVQESAAWLSPADVKRLWSMRNEQQVVMARGGAGRGVFDEQFRERLSACGQQLRQRSEHDDAAGRIHMIRRDTARELLADHDTSPVRADPPHPPRAQRPAGSFVRHLKQLALGD
jgi:glycosyltransferase involved in cell wall biosynthesis